MHSIFVLDYESPPPNHPSVASIVRERGLHPRVFHTLAELEQLCDAGNQSGCLIANAKLLPESDAQFVEQTLLRNPAFALILVIPSADITVAVRLMRAGSFSVISSNELTPLEDEIRLALQWSDSHAESSRRIAEIGQRMAQLTSQEREILDMLMDGQANKTIAKHLGLSTRTIENRRRQLYSKLETQSVPELVRAVVEWKIQQQSTRACLA